MIDRWILAFISPPPPPPSPMYWKLFLQVSIRFEEGKYLMYYVQLFILDAGNSISYKYNNNDSGYFVCGTRPKKAVCA